MEIHNQRAIRTPDATPSVSMMRHPQSAMLAGSRNPSNKVQSRLIVHAPPDGPQPGHPHECRGKVLAHPQGNVLPLGADGVGVRFHKRMTSKDLRIQTIHVWCRGDQLRRIHR